MLCGVGVVRPQHSHLWVTVHVVPARVSYQGLHCAAASALFRTHQATRPWLVCCSTTGWALCGHDAPAGEGAGCCSDGEVGNDDDAEDREERNRSKAAGGTSGGRDGAMATAAGAADEAAAAALSGSKRARSPEAEAVGGGGDGGEGAAAAEEREAQAVAGVEGKPAQQELGQGFDPARCLSRIERMALGQKCKQLIEAGRLEWMRGRFGACELVCYVGPEVTGENRLLLAVA